MDQLTVGQDILAQVQEAMAVHQPELSVTTVKNIIVLEGLFVVAGPKGPFDSYQVRVGIPAGFPWQEPLVFETADRIPKIDDRHIFPERGDCCLGVWEEWLLTASDHTFKTFLTGVLHDYFVSQSWFEAKGEWPFGDRSHGLAGVLESFADLLGVENNATIIAEHLELLSMNEVKGHHSCPCGAVRNFATVTEAKWMSSRSGYRWLWPDVCLIVSRQRSTQMRPDDSGCAGGAPRTCRGWFSSLRKPSRCSATPAG